MQTGVCDGETGGNMDDGEGPPSVDAKGSVQINDARGARVSGDVCAAGCAVQEGGRAGCEEGALGGEHAAIAEERAVLCAVALPCCPDSLAATSRARATASGRTWAWQLIIWGLVGCAAPPCRSLAQIEPTIVRFGKKK